MHRSDGHHRGPHLGIRQWDEVACEAAVTAQLLFMAGRLDYPFDTVAFDAWIGRSPHQLDLEGNCIRRLLEAGFEILTVGPYDLTHLSSNIDYYRWFLIDSGNDPAAVEGYYRQMYPSVAHRIRCVLDHYAAYAGQHRQDHDQLTADSLPGRISQLLSDNYIVGYQVVTSRSYGHMRLITAETADGRYEIYDPAANIYTPTDHLPRLTPASALAGAVPSLFGYRLPTTI